MVPFGTIYLPIGKSSKAWRGITYDGGNILIDSPNTIRVYFKFATSAAVGDRPYNTRSTSSCNSASASGFCESKYHTQVSAVEVVSKAVKKSVSASSLSC